MGEGRQQVVADMAARYEEVIANSEPHLICLVAEAGWGKTRIVQEFYSWLQRERQPEGEYWPPEMATGQADPMRSRKVVYPDRVMAYPDLPMPWLWLGLLCEEGGGGRKLRALLNDGVQLPGHLAALIEVAERRAGDRDLAMTVLGEAIGFVPGIGQIASALLAAKDLVPRLRERLLDGIKTGERQAASERAPRPIEALRLGGKEVGPYVELVREFISPQLPLVLVVDDAHHADPGTIEFIATILLLEVPILIVCTAWSSTLADQVAEDEEVDREERTTFGSFLHELEVAEPTQFSRVELAPLSEDDLEVMVAEAAPETSKERRQALVETSGGNPLVLRLQMTAPKVLRSKVGGAITLSTEELHQLPRKYERLIGDRYDDLEEPDKRWLAEAAAQGMEFLPEYMSAATGGLDRERLGAFVRRFPVGNTEIGRFIESPVRAAILGAAEDEFSDEDRQAWGRGTMTALQRDAEEVPEGNQLREVWCRLLLHLAEDPANLELADAGIVADAAVELSFLERDASRHKEEMEAAEAAVLWAKRSGPDLGLLVRAAIRLAAALRANNDAKAAVDQAEAAAGLLAGEPEVAADLLCDVLFVLASALLQDERVEAAREVAGRALGAAGDDAQRITALRSVAQVEEAGNDLDAASAALEEALKIARAADPVDVEMLIRLETDITDLDPFMGSPDRWEAHLRMIEERLGSGHHLYRYCLFSAALQILFADGDPLAAEPYLEQLERFDDPDLRGDLEAVRSLQGALSSGDFDALGSILSDLTDAPYSVRVESRKLQTVLRAMGRSLPDGDRDPSEDGELTGPFGLLGQILEDRDRGLAALAEAIRDSAMAWTSLDRVMGVHLAVGALSDHLLETGTVSPVSPTLVSAVEDLIASQDRFPLFPRLLLTTYTDALEILDGGDPAPEDEAMAPMFRVRALAMHAVAAHSAGRPQLARDYLHEARSMLTDTAGWAIRAPIGAAYDRCDPEGAQAVWREILEWPGLGEGERLMAKGRIAGHLFRAGQLTEAEALGRAVVDGRRALGGEDDPGTRQAKAELAYTLEAAGRLTEARDLFREVVESRARTLGDEHSLTVSSKRWLSYLLKNMGELEEAEALLDAALYRYRCDLGDEHDTTLTTMLEFAELLAEVGRAEEGQEYAEHVVAVRESDQGAEAAATNAAKVVLAWVLWKQDCLVLAMGLEREIVASRSESLGRDHPSTLDAMHSLAVTYLSLRRLPSARDLEQEVADERERILGEDHRATAAATELLGQIFWAMMEAERATETMQLAIDRFTAAVGADHPDTQRASSRLAAMRSSPEESDLRPPDGPQADVT